MKVESMGTGKGFELFCTEGKSDIVNASRPVNEQEQARCKQIGRTPLPFPSKLEPMPWSLSSTPTITLLRM